LGQRSGCVLFICRVLNVAGELRVAIFACALEGIFLDRGYKWIVGVDVLFICRALGVGILDVSVLNVVGDLGVGIPVCVLVLEGLFLGSGDIWSAGERFWGFWDDDVISWCRVNHQG